ncbi:MAG: cadherin-like beta sandwich domain-containing protein [Clostridia bacterium]|nr:cadherin-like beta sandwich domain-containing protein [Clostridia bacterium]
MSKKKLLFKIICVALCVALLSAELFASAAILPFETQYDYDEADIAWLTDLVIKEDMTTVEGMAQRVNLMPEPEYPYTETPESFKKDVEYFVSLYNLELGSQRAGYIYFFEILNANSTLLAADVSDAEVKEYLEGMGIECPDNAGSDELVMARALFVALVTGAYGADSFTAGADLEEAIVSYLAYITGMNMNILGEWMPGGSVRSLDEYILAASKLALWSNGYDVSIDTSEDEVYRLMAVMTVKAQGISVDSDSSFDSLKAKYIAALLGKKYSVVIDSAKLEKHLENGTTAFYMLQLLGKQGGLSVREDNASYEEAFRLVSENTHAFDVSSDDFYADIYEYSATLSARRSSLWIYPTAYATDSIYNCIVSVNGTPVKNNYYNEIAIDPMLPEQVLIITVTATGSSISSKCTYTVHITQGTYAGIEGDEPVTNPGPNESFVSGDSLVAGILSSIGVNSVISDILDKSYSSLPAGLSGVVSFIAPTFDADEEAPAETEEYASARNDQFFISVLDEIGAVADAEIEGIPGLSLIENLQYGDDSMVTFG